MAFEHDLSISSIAPLPLNDDGVGAVVIGQDAEFITDLPQEETLATRPGLPSNFGSKLVLFQQLFLYDRWVDTSQVDYASCVRPAIVELIHYRNAPEN